MTDSTSKERLSKVWVLRHKEMSEYYAKSDVWVLRHILMSEYYVKN